MIFAKRVPHPPGLGCCTRVPGFPGYSGTGGYLHPSAHRYPGYPGYPAGYPARVTRRVPLRQTFFPCKYGCNPPRES
eukprot:180358-Rhodomonas_salina.1